MRSEDTRVVMGTLDNDELHHLLQSHRSWDKWLSALGSANRPNQTDPLPIPPSA